MNNLLTKIDKLPWQTAIMFCLTLGLAPFVPPHFYEKLKMLFVGTLVRPIDIFDFCFHGLPWGILSIKIVIYFKKSKTTYEGQS